MEKLWNWRRTPLGELLRSYESSAGSSIKTVNVALATNATQSSRLSNNSNGFVFVIVSHLQTSRTHLSEFYLLNKFLELLFSFLLVN